MKLFIDIVMKRIYLFNIVAWNYRKKTGFPVCKKENFAGDQAHRKREKSARASPTPHHTLNEERSARFTAQPLSALAFSVYEVVRRNSKSLAWILDVYFESFLLPRSIQTSYYWDLKQGSETVGKKMNLRSFKLTKSLLFGPPQYAKYWRLSPELNS